MAAILAVGEDPSEQRECQVRVAWVGQEDEDPTWELPSEIYADVLGKLELNK